MKPSTIALFGDAASQVAELHGVLHERRSPLHDVDDDLQQLVIDLAAYHAVKGGFWRYLCKHTPAITGKLAQFIPSVGLPGNVDKDLLVNIAPVFIEEQLLKASGSDRVTQDAQATYLQLRDACVDVISRINALAQNAVPDEMVGDGEDLSLGDFLNWADTPVVANRIQKVFSFLDKEKPPVDPRWVKIFDKTLDAQIQKMDI